MATEPMILDENTFDDIVAASDKPVLVDFWAEWCGPCLRIAPYLKEIADEESDRLVVGKLDVDAHPDIQAQYQIMAIPTLILFKDGKEVKRIRGALPKDALLAQIRPFIG